MPQLTNDRSRGSAITITIVALGVVATVMAMTAGRLAPAPTMTSKLPTPPPLTSADVRVTLHLMGLTPEALAAARVSEADVGQTVTAVRTDLTDTMEGIKTLRTALGDAARTADDLERKVQSGRASIEEKASLPSVRANLTSATSALAAAMDGLWSRTTVHLSSEQRQIVQHIKANSSRRLPAQYLVADRDDADWVTLRDAIAAVRFATSRQEPAPEAAQTILTAAEATPEIASALIGMQSLSAIKTAWNAATVVPNGDHP